MFELNLKNEKNTEIMFETDTGNVKEKMSVFEMARWLSLVESVDVVDKAARRMKIDLKKDCKWVKPLAFQKYINERTYGMIADIAINEDL